MVFETAKEQNNTEPLVYRESLERVRLDHNLSRGGEGTFYIRIFLLEILTVLSEIFRLIEPKLSNH